MALPELSDQDRNWYILKGYEIIENGAWRVWHLNGKYHREDGPAIEHIHQQLFRRYWYLNNEILTEEEFLEIIENKH